MLRCLDCANGICASKTDCKVTKKYAHLQLFERKNSNLLLFLENERHICLHEWGAQSLKKKARSVIFLRKMMLMPGIAVQ